MLLVIDSATAACSVALIGEDGAPIGGRRPASILVDCGPGSFTGVRVGLAAAHGLAIGWGVPLAGFSSLALIAAAGGAAEAAVALPGGHGEIFVQSYGGDPLRALDDLRSLAPGAAALSVAAELVLGPAAEALVAARGSGRWVHALPRAADAGALPAPLRALPPRPIYGRAPDAKPMT